MDHTNMTFVVYMGGTCGDLLTSLIDWSGSEINPTTSAMRIATDRQRLKKPHLFANDQERDQYVQNMCYKYKSLPSHDLEYHQRHSHKFITITVDTFCSALWAATRFQRMHRPQVWQEVQRLRGINTVTDYANMILDYSSMIKPLANSVITLDSILSGTATNDLEKLGFDIAQDVKQLHYPQWLNNIGKS